MNIEKAKTFSRNSLLKTNRSKSVATAPKVHLVVTRNPRLPPLQEIVNKPFHIFQWSDILSKIFESHQTLFTGNLPV